MLLIPDVNQPKCDPIEKNWSTEKSFRVARKIIKAALIDEDKKTN